MGRVSNARTLAATANRMRRSRAPMPTASGCKCGAGTSCICALPEGPRVSVIQVIRHGASEGPRDPKVSWFVWKGDEPAPLAEISPTYRLRYSQEHGYRLDKQVRLGDEPRLRTPEQTERWTQIVACAHNQLVLARPLLP